MNSNTTPINLNVPQDIEPVNYIKEEVTIKKSQEVMEQYSQ